MKVIKPDENILSSGKDIDYFLSPVCDKRIGKLKAFFATYKTEYIADNVRFYQEFNADRNYTKSAIDYAVVKKQLNGLYDSATVDNERSYIKEFRKSQRAKKCPYCLKGNCKTLDHYFDKASYPELSLNVWNLAPSCGDCNYAKLSEKIVSSDQRFLHPLFDDYYQDIESYFVRFDIFNVKLKRYVGFNLEANPGLKDTAKINVINWHIIKMETNRDHVDNFREDFMYWIGKATSRMERTSPINSLYQFLYDELKYEKSFNWRAVILNSIICDETNFYKFYDLIKHGNYVV